MRIRRHGEAGEGKRHKLEGTKYTGWKGRVKNAGRKEQNTQVEKEKKDR